MKRAYALALVCLVLFVGGSTLTGCSKPPEEKSAAAAPQAEAKKGSPSKGSLTDTSGP